MSRIEISQREGTEAILQEEPDLNNPVFIEGLTGIGHIGRNAVAYLIDQLEAEKFGEILSNHFAHWTIVDDEGELDLLNNEFYYWKSDEENQRDVIFLQGDAQSVDPMGHYIVVNTILDVLKRFDVNEMITLGGYGTGNMVDEPSVLGVTTHNESKQEYKDIGVEFDHDVGQIIGASGLILGVGARYGMDGVCLLGETPGFLLSDPKATEAVLQILEEKLDVEVDYGQLQERIEEEEQVIKKIRDLQQQAQRQEESEEGGELGYIG